MPKKIPEIMRRLRVDVNYSQEYVAEKIGVDVSTYARYEKGETQLKFDQAAAIADLYNLTLDEFYHYGEKRSLSMVEEPSMMYGEPAAKVVVHAELDGTKETLKEVIARLTRINEVILKV